MSDLNASVVRRSLRALVLTPAVVLPMMAAPAFAAPPDTWPAGDEVGALDFLLVLLVIPLALALVISLLATVPTLVRGEKYTPGHSWRNQNEWFGGPKDGLEAADKESATESSGERGGSSARW